MLLVIAFFHVYGVSAHYKPNKDTNKPSPPILQKASNCSHFSSRVSDISTKHAVWIEIKSEKTTNPTVSPLLPSASVTQPPSPRARPAPLFPSFPFPSVLGELEGFVPPLRVTSKQLVTALTTDAFLKNSNIFFQLEENTLLSRSALLRKYSRYDIVPV